MNWNWSQEKQEEFAPGLYPDAWDNAARSIESGIEVAAAAVLAGAVVIGGLVGIGVKTLWGLRNRHREPGGTATVRGQRVS